MNKADVVTLLKAHQNQRGIEHWKQLDDKTGQLKSYGIGLTQLRKLAKQIGRDHALAMELWESDTYDLRVMALLIDDPKAMTPEQAETQVEQLGPGMLSHVFSSCDASLAKTSFVVELADKWINSNDSRRRGCGYGLLYEVSKSTKKSAPDDTYFLEHIERIRKTLDKQEQPVQIAMRLALMGMGKRNAKLNAAALNVARSIGPLAYSDDKCDPFDVAKHLTTDRLQKKLRAAAG